MPVEIGSVAMIVTDAPGLRFLGELLARRYEDAEPSDRPFGTIQKFTIESVPRERPTLVIETCAVTDFPQMTEEPLIFRLPRARSAVPAG